MSENKVNSLINWLSQLHSKLVADKNTAQLYKRGIIKQYIRQYWKWLLLGMIMPLTAQGALPCDSYTVAEGTSFRGKDYSSCNCLDINLRRVSGVTHYILDGDGRGSLSVERCTDEGDSTCGDGNPSGAIDISNETTTFYFKHWLFDGDFYTCDWTKNVGYSNARKHTPSLPTSSGSPSTPPQPVNANTLNFNWIISGLFSLLIFFGVIGLHHHRPK